MAERMFGAGCRPGQSPHTGQEAAPKESSLPSFFGERLPGFKS